jgi:hypothetical protein
VTNASRATIVRFLAVAVLLIPATAWAQTRPPIFDKVANTHGLDSWNQIEVIRYTWNLQLGALNVSRSMGVGAQNHQSLLRGERPRR